MKQKKFISLVLLLSMVLSGCQSFDFESTNPSNTETAVSSEETVRRPPEGWETVSLTESEWEYYQSMENSYWDMPPTQEELYTQQKRFSDLIGILNNEKIYKIEVFSANNGGITFDITDSETIARWISLIKKYEVGTAEGEWIVGGQEYVLYFYYDENEEPVGITSPTYKNKFLLPSTEREKVMLQLKNYDELANELIALEEEMGFDRQDGFSSAVYEKHQN